MTDSKAARPGEEAQRDAARIAAEISNLAGGTDPFVAAVRATRMPMIITNPRQHDNPVVFANNAFCLLSGYSREEILGRNCRFLQCDETDPETVRKIRDAVREVRSIETDIRNKRKTGELFWNRLLMAPVRDADGELAYFFASQVDVTLERERLEGLETHNAALIAELANRLHTQQDSEARLRFAAQAGRLGIWELDLRTKDLTTSAVCRENFGRDPDAPLSYPELVEAVYPDDRVRMAAAVDHALATGAEYQIEYRLQRPDGSIGWVAVRAQVVRADSGVPLRMAGISFDVTDRHAEDVRRHALLELADRFRDVQDVAELAYASAEVLGRALGVDRAGYGVIDPIAETITIERDWNAPGVDSLAGTLHFRDYGSYIDDLKRGETVVCGDAERDPRTAETAGALQAINASSFVNMPLTEQGGFVALFYLNHGQPRVWTEDELALMRDVAERTRTAIERRRAEHELQALNISLEAQVAQRTAERDRVWRNSRDLLIVMDKTGVFRAINPAWTAILGHDLAEVEGRHFREFLWPEDRASTDQALIDANQRNLTNFENRYRHKDGTPRWFSWRTTTEGGEIYAYGRHVTAEHEQGEALLQTQEALRQSQKMEALGQLTGGIAHDFNNLLTGIIGSIDIVQRRIAAGRTDDLDRFMEGASTSAQRAAALTHRLLAFSRRQSLDTKPSDVNRLVVGLEDILHRTLGEQVALRIDLEADLCPAMTDANQLESAILNMAINARDAMPEGGRLTIETTRAALDSGYAARHDDVEAGEYVVLSVSDTGHGMAPETVAKAFDPFFTTKPIGQGTGLGLSMIYGFAKQSGGHVRIYSEVGRGTTIKLYLRRATQALDGTARVHAAAPDVPRGRGETVLVVEDEDTVRALILEALHELGYRHLEASDARTAIPMLQSDARIDLMVTDVGLPHMNGRQLAEIAREARPDLRILFVTGYAENAAVRGGFLDEGMDMLTKPFAMDALAAKIGSMIERD